MTRSNSLFLLIVACFFISFIGYIILIDQSVLNPLWYGSALLGIILFIVRIVRGDD
jgi:hypothetical protein